MIFSELYSAYYKTIALIIRRAIDHPLDKNEIRNIVESNAFQESLLYVEPAILDEKWQLITSDGNTPIRNVPDMPLTLLEKRWIKAVMLDPRVRLFLDDTFDLPDVEPLFTPEDYLVFDKYNDGDDFHVETYIKNFRMILDAIKNESPLVIETENRRGKILSKVVIPRFLEYSEKDDKFRLYAAGRSFGETINLGRIRKCERFEGAIDKRKFKDVRQSKSQVVFLLYDTRNALERVLLHFAHFEKQAEKLEENLYKITIIYNKDDETELEIRILSYGPMIKVIEPESFVEQICSRLRKQKSCGV